MSIFAHAIKFVSHCTNGLCTNPPILLWFACHCNNSKIMGDLCILFNGLIQKWCKTLTCTLMQCICLYLAMSHFGQWLDFAHKPFTTHMRNYMHGFAYTLIQYDVSKFSPCIYLCANNCLLVNMLTKLSWLL